MTYFTLVRCLVSLGRPTLRALGSFEYFCDAFHILYFLYLSLIFLAVTVVLQDGCNINPESVGTRSLTVASSCCVNLNISLS